MLDLTHLLDGLNQKTKPIQKVPRREKNYPIPMKLRSNVPRPAILSMDGLILKFLL
jgi:hypothetical protein